jgi:hypothetical protein
VHPQALIVFAHGVTATAGALSTAPAGTAPMTKSKIVNTKARLKQRLTAKRDAEVPRSEVFSVRIVESSVLKQNITEVERPH